MLSAGRLRHRVTIEKPVEDQDPVTGEITRDWRAVFTDLPAAIEPVSVREFIAAQQTQSQITTMIVIRYVTGLTANMRIRHGATIYNPSGFLPDKVSNAEYLTVPCTEGTNEG